MKGATMGRSDGDQATHRIEAEVRSVMSAIELVASDAAIRVTLVGLSFGEQVADALGAEATRRGLLLERLYWADDTGSDLLVRRNDDA